MVSPDNASGEEPAGTLAVSNRIAYTCDGGVAANVTMYGAEEKATITVAGILDSPAYLDCSPTRAGPECTNDSLRVLMNIVSGTAQISDSESDFSLSCTEATPG
ncbi:MAG: hypothetical protein R3B98_07435 [Hyphomonas sp.]